MKKSYLSCLKKLKHFRKSLTEKENIKRGKLYFDWIGIKTEKIENEKDDNYIYKKLKNDTLKNYVITQYEYNRATKELKRVIKNNYILKNKEYIFNNNNISFEDTMLLAQKIVLKRGNVVWIDFGFNIGKEFGGMHPAIILKSFDNELMVVPVSSKKPAQYKELELKLNEGKITQKEYEKEISKVTAVIQLDKIYNFKDITRWADITRMRKVSILRLNFSSNIGNVKGNDMEIISQRIREEF